jgi:hypothetical protein
LRTELHGSNPRGRESREANAGHRGSGGLLPCNSIPELLAPVLQCATAKGKRDLADRSAPPSFRDVQSDSRAATMLSQESIRVSREHSASFYPIARTFAQLATRMYSDFLIACRASSDPSGKNTTSPTTRGTPFAVREARTLREDRGRIRGRQTHSPRRQPPRPGRPHGGGEGLRRR